MHGTIFADVNATRMSMLAMPWPALIRKLEGVKPVEDKAHCRLIKLATFGNKRTDKNCLRHDANVLDVYGVEGDYDAGEIGVDEAVRRLERAGIRALVYTSPSHTDEKPRWRVLAPLSKAYPPADRNRFLARINGALGGILATESFTLSQSYYYGPIEGRPYLQVPTFDDPDEGTCVDQLDELDDIAVMPPTHINGAGINGASDAELLEAIRSGEKYHESLVSLAARYCGRGMAPVDITSSLQGLMDQYKPGGADLSRWQARREEIPRIVDGAVRKFTRPEPGVDKARNVEPDGPAASNGAPDYRLPLVYVRDIDGACIALPQLVEDVLTADGLSVTYGPSNSGKSYLTLTQDCAIARGANFLGKRTVAGLVLYVAGEGAASIKMRIAAYKRFHKIDDFPLVIVPQAVNLLDPGADVPRIIDAAKRAEDALGVRCVKVTVDTLARAFGGGNENSSEDMGAVIRHADMIRAALAAHLGFVHHSGKDESKGSRGHSSLRAATDTEIEVSASGDRLHTMEIVKQRDLGSMTLRLSGRFAPMAFGVDQWGKEQTVCIVEDAETAPRPAEVKCKGKFQRLLLGRLRTGGPMNRTDARAFLEAAGASKRTGFSAIDSLLLDRLIEDTVAGLRARE